MTQLAEVQRCRMIVWQHIGEHGDESELMDVWELLTDIEAKMREEG